MNAKGVRERGERGCGEALGHPIRPVEVGGDVNELQGAVAGLLTKVVSAHVEVLGRELVGGVGRDGERGLVVDVEHGAVAAAGDGSEEAAEVSGFFGGDGRGVVLGLGAAGGEEALAS